MIYLDSAATSRPYQEAVDIFSKVSMENFGNPSSLHQAGFAAKKILEEARMKVLSSLGLSSTHNCIFLSGASEANSMAIKSILLRYQNRGRRAITSSLEHPSVTNAFLQMEDLFGFEPTFLPPDETGSVPVSSLEAALDKNVILSSFMEVNNETGAIFPIRAYAEALKPYPKALLHVDATQGISKVDSDYSCCDLISFSAHKIGGVKGSGCLLYRKNLQFAPLVSGGEQEFGYRAGTVSVASAASLAKALQISLENRKRNWENASLLCAELEKGLLSISEVRLNSPKGHSPYLCNFSLLSHKASVVVEALSERGIYVSSVSACSSKKEPVSEVLLSMGKTQREAANSIRVSFSPDSTEGDVAAFLANLKQILSEVKPL